MRRGKLVDENDPAYLLDKNRGVCHIPIYNGGSIEVRNLKFKNRDAFDANYFELKVGEEVLRIQKDELDMALKYV